MNLAGKLNAAPRNGMLLPVIVNVFWDFEVMNRNAGQLLRYLLLSLCELLLRTGRPQGFGA